MYIYLHIYKGQEREREREREREGRETTCAFIIRFLVWGHEKRKQTESRDQSTILEMIS